MTSILPSDLIAVAPFLFKQNDTASSYDWTWKETPNSHIFKFDLPGYSKSDINIQIHTDSRILHITSKTEHKQSLDNNDLDIKNVTWHCKERVGTGGEKISKKFRLPKDAKIDCIEASMKDGVLIVTVAKESDRSSGGVIDEEVLKNKTKRSIVIEGKDEDRSGVGKNGGVLGKCFVCFKS